MKAGRFQAGFWGFARKISSTARKISFKKKKRQMPKQKG
jgi:hypothetical protein